MYCSIDKIDLAARAAEGPIAVQVDHRSGAEIVAELELSVLYAMARVLNARAHLSEEGHAGATVRFAMSEAPPHELREALAAVDATLESPLGVAYLGPGDARRAGQLADRWFAVLADRVRARVGSRDVAIALQMLEAQTAAAPPHRDDEAAYWRRVLELAALAGELLRAKYPGRWIQTDRAVVPFGFQVYGGTAVMFPTNRAQRVIEDGPGESLFKLLLAAEETVRHPSDAATGRLMPSLRHRRDVELDEVVWRPIVEGAPPDLPIVVCGIDGETTFGMIRREALGKPIPDAFDEALVNLGDEQVECEELEIGGLPVVMVSGNFYAAEKLLDRDLLLALHDNLGSHILVAAAPARGCLLITAAYRDPRGLAKFAAIARARYDDGGGRKISPGLLVIERGRIAGYVHGSADPAEHGERGAGDAGGSARLPRVK